MNTLTTRPEAVPHSTEVATNGDKRYGQRLTAVVQTRFTATQHAYLTELAHEHGRPISDEIRACVDEAIVASIETRRRRQQQVDRALKEIADGTADPEDYPDLISVHHGSSDAR